MALISMRQLLDYAAEQQFAIPAFNVSNMEQVQAIMQAADAVDSPVILQGSAGSRSYAGEPFLRHLILAAIEQYPHLPVVMHQDHGSEPAVCARSIQSGFSSVMMDGSLMSDMKTPSSFDYNVDVTRRVVEMAHACGVSVEGELGCLGSLETGMMGEEDGHGSDDKLDHSQLLTDPDEAVEFIRQTHVDALAVAIGTSHGAYKFSKPPTADVLAISHLQKLQQRLPNTHFVMHGSSSVPQDWLQIINNYGGDIAQTYGVPVEERSSQALSLAYAKSILIPIYVWPPLVQFDSIWASRNMPAILTPVNSIKPLPRQCRLSANPAMKLSVVPGMPAKSK